MGNRPAVINTTNEHDVALEEIKLEYEAKKAKKIWTGDRDRIQAALFEYEKSSVNLEGYLKQAVEKKSIVVEKIASLEGQLSDVQQSVENFNRKNKLLIVKKEAEKLRLKYVAYCDEINQAIRKTSVHSDLIPEFLSLVDKIAPSVAKAIINSEELDICFKNFHTMINRECCDKLSIDTYFGDQKLQRFVPTLVLQGMCVLEDLECDDVEEVNDEVFSVLKSAINAAKEQKEIDGKENDLAVELSPNEIKKIKKICLKPGKWQKIQEDRARVNNYTFSQSSQPMATFFEKMHFSLHDAAKLLQIGDGYNASQHLALSANANRSIKKNIKTITNIGEAIDDDDDDDDNKYDCVHITTTTTTTAAVANSKRITVFGKITRDNEIMNDFAIASINVIQSMEEDFVDKPLAKTFAITVEGACTKIIETQFTLRRSIALAREIVKMKPANITPESKPLWDAVNQGCKQIYKSTINIAKVSAEYFGFFLRFKQSFERYMASMKVNENCSFAVSLEFLRQDLRAFLAFKTTYEAKLAELNVNGTKCFNKCIDVAFESQNFLVMSAERENARKEYVLAAKNLARAELEIDNEYLPLKSKERIIAADLAKQNFLLQTADSIVNHKQNKAYLNEQIRKLRFKLESAVNYIAVCPQTNEPILKSSGKGYGNINNNNNNNNSKNIEAYCYDIAEGNLTSGKYMN